MLIVVCMKWIVLVVLRKVKRHAAPNGTSRNVHAVSFVLEWTNTPRFRTSQVVGGIIHRCACIGILWHLQFPTTHSNWIVRPNSQHAGIFTTLLDRNPGCPISPAEVTTWYLPCPPNVSVLALVLVSSLTCWPEVLSFMTIALSLHWIFPSLILQWARNFIDNPWRS